MGFNDQVVAKFKFYRLWIANSFNALQEVIAIFGYIVGGKLFKANRVFRVFNKSINIKSKLSVHAGFSISLSIA